MKKTKLTAIVQARMGSRRLPGKVLQLIHGRPMLQYLLERLEHSDCIERIIIATSVNASDDAIADFCRARNVACMRGDEHDVASRFRAVAESLGLEYFVRVNGDSPLLDTAIVTRCLQCFQEGVFDLVTNIMPRTFPPGQSVEIIRSSAFETACDRMIQSDEREHVTLHFYRHNDQFRIANVFAEDACKGIHLAVDSAEDGEIIRRMIAAMDREHWTYTLAELIALYKDVRTS